MKRHMPSTWGFSVKPTPGAPLDFLSSQALSLLSSIPNPEQHNIYFMAGYCDLTRKINQGRYKEVIFSQNPAQAISKLSSRLFKISESIKRTGAKPIFCTIPPGSIRKWNETRLDQNKTSHLMHQHDYQRMQDNLNEAILEINRIIISINESNSVQTPHIASTIISKPGQNKNHRFHFGRLSDGVHPKPSLKNKWARTLSNCIISNRQT